jgi:15-cis-phytoene synthase
MPTLENSYAHCRQVARRKARNFYYSFVLLPREKRDALCALYAFMRRSDDLSDEPGASRDALEDWRAALGRVLADGHSREQTDPLWPAFADTVRRYKIPHEYFHHVLDGVASDLEPRRFEHFEELRRYCYQVASAVGLAVIHVFGYDSPAALPLAEECGIAFQLTNILRDLREDAARGRIYLPTEDLLRFGVTARDIESGQRGANLEALMRFEVERARGFYRNSEPLLDRVDRRSRASLWALMTIYSRLLDRIEDSSYDVFSRRISLSAAEKSWIALRAMMRV